MFIELIKIQGSPLIINLDHVVEVDKHPQGCRITLTGQSSNTILVAQDYKKVKEMISQATGQRILNPRNYKSGD